MHAATPTEDAHQTHYLIQEIYNGPTSPTMDPAMPSVWGGGGGGSQYSTYLSDTGVTALTIGRVGVGRWVGVGGGGTHQILVTGATILEQGERSHLTGVTIPKQGERSHLTGVTVPEQGERSHLTSVTGKGRAVTRSKSLVWLNGARGEHSPDLKHWRWIL